jgi:hypothetical protein
MKLYNNGHQWQLPGQQDKHADRVEIPTDAAGLCQWLNNRRLAAPSAQPELRAVHDHQSNEPNRFKVEGLREAKSYTAQSLSFEDAFAAMPLSLKLHYAALAMEAARDAL